MTIRFDGMRAAVIWNPGAGTVSQATAMRAALDRHPEAIVVETTSAEHAQDVVRGACEAGVPRIVAAGGDGTVNQVVNAILRLRGEADVAFGVLPLGSGNDFARIVGTFGDPDPVAACLSGPIRPVDLIRATWDGGERIVVNMATGGNTGHFLEVLDDDVKRAWGPLVYVRGVVDLLRDLRDYPATVRFDDEAVEVDMFNFFVANGRSSGGGLTVSPNASLFDEQMEATIVRAGDAGEIVELTADYMLQAFLENDLVEQRQCRRFVVQGVGPIPVSIDGDLVTDGPIEFVVLPKALPTIFPAEKLQPADSAAGPG